MKAILLVRVSTDAQDTEPQKNALVTKANELGFTELHIIESHESGFISMSEREGIQSLFGFIKNNNDYKTVFCTEQSRIGRDLSDLFAMRRWFKSNGISLFDLSRNNYIITGQEESVENDLFFNIMAAMAEMESKIKADRGKRAIIHYWKSGESHIGKVIFGYEKEINFSGKRKKLAVHRKNGDIVKEIFNLYEFGIPESGKENTSILDIVRYCIKKGYPRYTTSKSNIKKLLKETAYTGSKTTNNKRYIYLDGEKKSINTSNEFSFPIIISQEQFERVQDLLKNRTVSSHSYKHITLLAKKIKCHICNLHYIANYRRYKESEQSSYRCSGRHKEPPCMNKSSISVKMLDNVIWSLIKSDRVSLMAAINNLSPEKQIQSWKYEADSLLSQIEKRTNDFQLKSGLIERFVSISRNLNDERINKLEIEAKNISKDIDKLNSRYLDVTNKINNYDFEYIKSLNANVKSIESSLDSVRTYIDFFIDKIHIIKHCKRYTHIRVSLKYSRDVESHFPGSQVTQFSNSKVFDDIELIIDKLNTNKLSIYKSRNSITLTEFNGDVTLSVGNFTTTLNKLRREVNVRIDSNYLDRIPYTVIFHDKSKD